MAHGCIPPSEPMFTIRPRAAFRCGCAAFATRNGPRVFTSNIASHSATLISSMRHRLKRARIVHQQVEPAQTARPPRSRPPHTLDSIAQSQGTASACPPKRLQVRRPSPAPPAPNRDR